VDGLKVTYFYLLLLLPWVGSTTTLSIPPTLRPSLPPTRPTLSIPPTLRPSLPPTRPRLLSFSHRRHVPGAEEAVGREDLTTASSSLVLAVAAPPSAFLPYLRARSLDSPAPSRPWGESGGSTNGG
jgi:hypothetical protein